MPSKFHEKAISRITPEQRALMVKSLEVISQIHSILDRKGISQVKLAEMLDVSPPAVSKMLNPGGNLELNTIIRLELLLKEDILNTPQKVAKLEKKKQENLEPIKNRLVQMPFMAIVWKAGEPRYFLEA
jgi:predicted transcriptional regulator